MFNDGLRLVSNEFYNQFDYAIGPATALDLVEEDGGAGHHVGQAQLHRTHRLLALRPRVREEKVKGAGLKSRQVNLCAIFAAF